MRLIDKVIVVLFARLYSIVTKHSFISFILQGSVRLFLFFFFFPLVTKKDLKAAKKITLTSKWRAKHLFARQNTQQIMFQILNRILSHL